MIVFFSIMRMMMMMLRIIIYLIGVMAIFRMLFVMLRRMFGIMLFFTMAKTTATTTGLTFRINNNYSIANLFRSILI